MGGREASLRVLVGKAWCPQGGKKCSVIDVVDRVIVWPGEENRRGRCGLTVPVCPLVTGA